MFVVLLRQVYRTFPSLIEDMGNLIFFGGGGGGGKFDNNHCPKKFSKKINLLPKKGIFFKKKLPNLLGFKWGKTYSFPTYLPNQTKNNSNL
jgi:hypothetical protein